MRISFKFIVLTLAVISIGIIIHIVRLFAPNSSSIPSIDDQSVTLQSFPKQLWFGSTSPKQIGTPNDYLKLFRDDTTWTKTRDKISVFNFWPWQFNKEGELTQAQLNDIVIPKLKEWNMNVSIEVGGGTYTCNDALKDIARSEEEMVTMFREKGVKLNYLTMDSPLLQPWRAAECPNYGFNKRVADMITYIKRMKLKFPDIKIGFTDPVPNRFINTSEKAPLEAYKQMVAKLKEANVRVHGKVLSSLDSVQLWKRLYGGLEG